MWSKEGHKVHGPELRIKEYHGMFLAVQGLEQDYEMIQLYIDMWVNIYVLLFRKDWGRDEIICRNSRLIPFITNHCSSIYI